MTGDPVIRVAVAGAAQAGKSTLVARLQYAVANNRIAVSDLASLDSFAALVTSAAAADAAVVVVDASVGLHESVARDLAVASLLRVDTVLLAVAKMDDVAFEQVAFDRVVADFDIMLSRLAACGVQPVRHLAIPVAAMTGDNVGAQHGRLDWFAGPSLVTALAEVQPVDHADFAGRFPVQVVIRPRTAEHPDYRGYAGRVEAGVFRPGDRVQALPSGWFSTILAIDTASGALNEAEVGRSVVLRLSDEIDVPRGETLVADAEPRALIVRDLSATVFWFGDRIARAGSRFRLRHGTRDVLCLVESVESRFATGPVEWQTVDEVRTNDIARVRFRLADPVVVDRYADSRTTGALVIVDEASGVTVAAGLVD